MDTFTQRTSPQTVTIARIPQSRLLPLYSYPTGRPIGSYLTIELVLLQPTADLCADSHHCKRLIVTAIFPLSLADRCGSSADLSANRTRRERLTKSITSASQLSNRNGLPSHQSRVTLPSLLPGSHCACPDADSATTT